MDRKQQINLGYALLAFLLLMMFQGWWAASRQIETIQYSEFQQLLDKGAVDEIRVSTNTSRIPAPRRSSTHIRASSPTPRRWR